MGNVFIHLFLFKYPRFILNLDDCIKPRKISEDTSISICLVGNLYVTGGYPSPSQVDVVDVSSATLVFGMQQQPRRHRYLSLAVNLVKFSVLTRDSKFCIASILVKI